MAERIWNKDQLNAITSFGGNILVSAAAGSGKTAVLVERVIRMLTDEQNPVDADRLLIVTFTRAAAAELRGRIREALEKALAEAEENKRKWYAVTAEYENYRRRTQNQAAMRYQEGRNDVMSALFPIGDNLERAMSACADENTKQGLDMILKAYKKVLEGEGVEEIDPVGQAFDATTMEAIMAMPAADGEESGIVKQVYLKGYKKGDKVLRYAQVIVTQ